MIRYQDTAYVSEARRDSRSTSKQPTTMHAAVSKRLHGGAGGNEDGKVGDRREAGLILWREPQCNGGGRGYAHAREAIARCQAFARSSGNVKKRGKEKKRTKDRVSGRGVWAWCLVNWLLRRLPYFVHALLARVSVTNHVLVG